MIKFKTFPSFRDDDSLVQLSDLLAVIPENNWVWAVLEFYGIGNAPNDLSMEDFEAQVRLNPNGFVMTWSELKDFVSALDQTFDCLIVAARSLKNISTDRSAKENFLNCEVVIEEFDRSEWSVWARDTELMQKFVTIY